MDVNLVGFGEVGEPSVLADGLDPVALFHAQGEGVGDGTQIGEGGAPHIL